jgi:CDP-diacylglycerol--glycerol-3-phosphate 3-phosphatidyltransferase
MSRRLKLRFVTFLTLVRYPLVLLFFVGAIVHTQWPRGWLFTVTLAALIASAVTDLLDGYFARRFRVETRFGAHADPLMDKFFYLSTLPVLVFVATYHRQATHGIVLLVLTMMFLARDQWVTFLRSIGALYSADGRAHWTGKLRTCINFPLICIVYFFEEAPVPLFSAWTVYTLEGVAIVVNLVSAYVYSRRYWPYLVRSTDFHD